MYTVSSSLYNDVASRLVELVGRAGYFSGSVTFDDAGTECRLTLSAVVCRHLERMPEGDFDTISDLVPVWWEFHTVTEEGEVPNDFSFSELRKYFYC